VLTNAIAHFVSGVMGRPFQCPFATSRESLSSSTVNVAWDFFNLVFLSVDLPRRPVRRARRTRRRRTGIAHPASRPCARPPVRQVQRRQFPRKRESLIASVGSGWAFPINALSFLAVMCSLSLLRTDRAKSGRRVIGDRGSLVEGFRYVRRRTDLQVILLMPFLVGTFGFNFAIFVSTMSVTVFHAGAGQIGLLTSMMAARSATGGLMATARAKLTISVLLADAATLGAGGADAEPCAVRSLFVVAVAAQTRTTSTNSLVQLSTEPGMRGRMDCRHLRPAVSA
jgi:hypothetical protein